MGDFWVLSAPVLRQIARYLPHHTSENASKTHPKSSHDKFKTASYIHRLVEKITTSPSNNMEFCYYGHLVSLQSGTTDYVDVTVYNTTDRYSGETAGFNFDYWTKELDIGYTESDRLFDVIVQVFQRIYGKRNVRVIIDEEENFD